MGFPRPYGLLFLYMEPANFLNSVSPLATAATYSALDQPLQRQLAAHLLVFAWLEAFVLRSTSDVKTRKALLFGMFL